MLLNVFLLTCVLSVGLQPLATRLGLIDHPDERRRHENPTPLCGGLAMLSAVVFVGMLDVRVLPASPAALIGIGLVIAIGVADDRWQLRAVPRLGGQLLAAMLIVGFGALGAPDLGSFAGLAGPAEVLLGLVIAVGLVVGLINSLNMIDGVDGLAGTVALSAFFWLCATALSVGNDPAAREAEVLMAATAGFLFWNARHRWRPRALVFLGDGGSTALGAAVAYLILVLSNGEAAVPLPSLIWVAAVPIIDTLSLIVRRLAAGHSPFMADRQHLHHLLLDLGLPPGAVTATIAAASFACGAIGFAGITWGLNDAAMAAALAIPAAAHLGVVHAARNRVRAGSGVPWFRVEAVSPEGSEPMGRRTIISRLWV